MPNDIPTHIETTVTALYCGRTMTTQFSPNLEFIDPLVKCTTPLQRSMFERLHRLFPYTEVRRLELRQMHPTTGDYIFDFEVHYKEVLRTEANECAPRFMYEVMGLQSPICAKIGNIHSTSMPNPSPFSTHYEEF